MSLRWLAIALAVPFALGMLLARPFWGRSRDSLGSAVGSVVILASAVGFMAREYVEAQQFTQACIALETACRFHPEPFTRFAIYAYIAMAQVATVFTLGAAVEHRMANSSFSEPWRR